LLAAAACVGTWMNCRARGVAFLAETAWIVAALGRLRGRLRGAHSSLEVTVCEDLLMELDARFHDHKSFDLACSTLAGC
jgi:hypothetical protein